MNFNIENELSIFNPIFEKRPEIPRQGLKQDLDRYYLPYAERIIGIKEQKGGKNGLIVGVSAIIGAGKTIQGEIMEILLRHFGYSSISLSIDNHYITHQELNELRMKDPRFIRRGVTHDIQLAVHNLTDLIKMEDGAEVKIPIYDRGAYSGDGDRAGWKTITQKPDFIFYDGWMLGAREVEYESVFDSRLPALETEEARRFARDVNSRLSDYEPLWDMIEFMNVLYVPDYRISLKWREQAEETLRIQGKGMSSDEIREFVYYLWRSVHPAIQIKALAHDVAHTQQVTIINEDHSIKEVLTPAETAVKYP